MARGLFLKKSEPLLAASLSNLFTASVFAIGHAGVTYSTDVLVFVAMTFVFALIWGYLMQNTGSLWLSRRRSFASLCAFLLFFCELAKDPPLHLISQVGVD